MSKNPNGNPALQFTRTEKAEFSGGGFSFTIAPPRVEIDGVLPHARRP
jgi:hypothetical protein